VAFTERKAHGSNLYQLFMREPVNGIAIELNFAWDEAVRLGRVPGWRRPAKHGPERPRALRRPHVPPHNGRARRVPRHAAQRRCPPCTLPARSA
jgi:hypothetical protein